MTRISLIRIGFSWQHTSIRAIRVLMLAADDADDADFADRDWFYLQVLIDIRGIRQIRVIRVLMLAADDADDADFADRDWFYLQVLIDIRGIRQIRVIRVLMLATDDADFADQDWFYIQVLIDIRAIRQIRVIRGHLDLDPRQPIRHSLSISKLFCAQPTTEYHRSHYHAEALLPMHTPECLDLYTGYTSCSEHTIGDRRAQLSAG